MNSIDHAEIKNQLRVVLSVAGSFHFFDLARELESHQVLDRIYSSFPWSRLAREAVPRQKVKTWPVIHPSYMLMNRLKLPLSRATTRRIELLNSTLFDRWVAARMPECEVFYALANNGLASGKAAQQRGAKYICDRPCSHIRYQNNIVSEEYARWGMRQMVCHPRTIEREEAEYAQADAIVVPSEFSRRSFLSLGVPAEKVHKIPYGVNLSRFSPVSAPPEDCFEVVFVGQVSFRKGIPYLLEAFRRFQHPRKRLRVVGPVLPEMRRFLSDHLPQNAEVLGPRPQSELSRILSTSHVLVLTSIEEGLALVQGQAMACGCALISTTNTGGSDLFTDGVEGFEVPIRSPEAITEKLELLASAPDLLAQMRHAALERVQSIGGWREYGMLHLALIQKLLQ